MKKLLTISLVLLFAGAAVADDFAPPDFRGDPLSYTVEWDAFTQGDFSAGIYWDAESYTDDSDPATYLYDQFSTHLDFDDPDGWAWYPDSQGGGIYNPDRNASFAAKVINWVDWLPEKKLRVQVIWTGTSFPFISSISGFGPVSGGEPHLEGQSDSSNEIGRFWEDWVISPNPDWEQVEFYVPQGTIIEQIVIDTISLPEPATLILLAAGGLALLKRRRSS